MASSNANLFTIAEYDIKDARKIVLRGRSLPFQGLSWTSKQRVDINYFPGNPVAIAQVVGATWADTKASGRWSDVFLLFDEHSPDLINFPPLAETGTPNPDPAIAARSATSPDPDLTTSKVFQSGGALPAQRATTAEAVREAMWKLSRGGQLLRVEWGSIVRYGYIIELVAKHDRREDIEWEMAFAWIGDRPTQPKPAPESHSVYEAITAPLAELNEMMRFLNGNREPLVNTLVLGGTRIRDVSVANFDVGSSLGMIPLLLEKYRTQFIQFLRRLNTSSFDLISALDFLTRAARTLDPRELLGNVKTALRGIRSAVDDMFDSFEVLGAAVAISFATNGNPSDVTVVDGLAREFRKLALRLAAECRLQEDQIDRFITPNIRVLLRPNVGISLRDISIQEYGTANNWRAIQEFNGFPDSVVPAGAIVRVPEIPTGEVTSERRARNSAPSSLTVAGVI